MTKTGGTGKNLKSGKGSISVNKNVILLIEDDSGKPLFQVLRLRLH